jgi:plastocyanin
MRGLRNAINHLRYIKTNNLLVIAFFAVGLFAFGALGLTQATGVRADIRRDCDDNAIMRCGAADANEFRAKYDQNAPGDLASIYGHYWIPRDLNVVQGQAFKDNTIRVNGRIVADNAQSIGRQQKPGDHAISIGGRTYWEGSNSTAFASDGLPVMVALDAQGNFKYAVLNGCGNPIYAHPVAPPPPPPPAPTPKYSCNSLNVQQLSTTQKRFTVGASASGGAQITGYSFNFGDGASQDSASATIDHTYAAPGTYTVVATVKVKVGNENKTASGPNCTKTFTIKAPAAVDCTALNVIDRGNNKYDFKIVETHTNATYKGATLSYGDGKADQITGTTASHQYAKAGNYSITATLSFDVDGTVKTANCTAQISTAPCPTNPALPAGSPDCAPCPYDSTLPKDSPKCVAPPVTPPVTPPVLPQTGPGDLMLGGVGVGSMIVSVSLYVASRRDFLAALLAH